ncbi:MAG: hypothetical protein V3U79_11700 [Dehalococcoidia bacterium]
MTTIWTVRNCISHPIAPTGLPVNFYFQARYRAWRWIGLKRRIRRIFAGKKLHSTLEELAGPLERKDYLGGCIYIARGLKKPG